MTLYRETPCEHGKIKPHLIEGSYRYWLSGDDCPGGSREEVTINYEAAASAVHQAMAKDEQWRLQEKVTAVQSRQAEARYAKAIVDTALSIDSVSSTV